MKIDQAFLTQRVVDNLCLRANIRKCRSSRSLVLLGLLTEIDIKRPGGHGY